MRRLLTGALALIAVLTQAAACGNDGDGASSSAAPAGSSGSARSDSGSSSLDGTSSGKATTDTSMICDASAIVAAVEGGPAEGTLAGMTDDPVATAASHNPVLTTLVTAVRDAHMGDTLNVAPELTVFAPTDCAFARFDQATLQAALADPDGLLTQVLGFHVVPERLSPEQLAAMSELHTFTGQTLSVSVDGDDIELNGGQARVVVPDIQTANATVYLIDSVMVPQA
jgi:transforming growth factor-beta-induced protein